VQITDEALSRYVAALWEANGSDLLLTAGAPPSIRVDAKLRPLPGEAPVSEEQLEQLVDALLLPRQREELEEHLDVDFSVGWGERSRLRGSAFRQRGLPALALRAIPDDIPSFDDLGVPASVRALGALRQGLVLFSGPTGSGKSTTQAALLDWINANRACHILTIEDPIEHLHEHKASVVSQRELGSDTHSFPRALRSALREDPDVLLVGEMRDLESIGLALTLAETGHLVISTLHTNDAAQALDRIVDVFPAERQEQIRIQLAGSLSAVVAQRLVPRAQGGGLVAAFEVLLATSAVRNLVREGKTRQLRNVMTTSQAEGMRTLEMSLNDLVAAGTVTHADAVEHAFVPKEVVAPTTAATPGTPG
jgi:twitching motility protein PilT